MPSFAAVADDDRTIGRAAPVASSTASTTALLGVSALLLAVPFERLEPLLVLPGQTVTNAEVVLVAVGLAWLTAVARSCTRPEWRTPLTLPWLALFAAMLLAAALAPTNRGNALNMAGRCGLAFGVYLLTVNAVTSLSRLQALLFVAAASGAVAGALVVLEYAGVAGVNDFLSAFRTRPTVVGTELRAAGPFQYPTIASMFLEILFAFALVWIPLSIDRDRSWAVIVAVSLLILIAEAIVLTFTRAGLGTMLIGLVVVGAVRWHRRGFDRAVQVLVAFGVVVLALFAGTRPLESLSLRMTSESTRAWFRATIEGPTHLQLRTGGTITVPLVVTNTGRSTWDPAGPSPFRLAYHWIAAAEDVVVDWEGVRTEFPEPVEPGERVLLEARVRAPDEPGEYRLMWDVEHEDRLWFSTEPEAPLAYASASVSGEPLAHARARASAVGRPLPLDAERPGRFALWGAAARMLAERPLLGVGPDNFRLRYGKYLGRSTFDTRIHTNSMYLEVLAGGGLLVFAVFAWFVWRAAERVWRALRQDGEVQPHAAAIAAAAIAIAVHGLVDAFWGFTATYVLMAVTLGLLVRVTSSLDGDAHRV
jgi:O-antigen ligase